MDSKVERICKALKLKPLNISDDINIRVELRKVNSLNRISDYLSKQGETEPVLTSSHSWVDTWNEETPRRLITFYSYENTDY